MIEKVGNDQDRNKKKVRHFEDAPDCPPSLRHKKRHCHCANKEKLKPIITPEFVMLVRVIDITRCLVQGQ